MPKVTLKNDQIVQVELEKIGRFIAENKENIKIQNIKRRRKLRKH